MQRLPLISLLFVALTLAGCVGESSESPSADAIDASGSDTAGADTVEPTDLAEFESCLLGDRSTQRLCVAWMRNESQRAAVLTVDGAAPLTDVQRAVVDGEVMRVAATGIPSYQITLDSLDVATLRSRDEADFRIGSPIVNAGDTVAFGGDVGYVSDGSCALAGGAGFWPPLVRCPTLAPERAFPLDPRPSPAACATDAGWAGSWLNGVAVGGWSNGRSYADAGVWHEVGPLVDALERDVCGGTTDADGIYRHAVFPRCLAEQLGDDLSDYSPVYGFAADGYPIRGPVLVNGVNFASCWTPRDYETADSPTGCGGEGARSCVLVDPTDLSQGTRDVAPGPPTSGRLANRAGRQVPAVSGVFAEDYYLDPVCDLQESQFLDRHNGHDDLVRGYHYHITETFPFTVGPVYAGALPEGAPCAPGDAWGPP